MYSHMNKEVHIAYSYYRLTLKCRLLSTIVIPVSMQAGYTVAIKRFSSNLHITSKYLTNTSVTKVAYLPSTCIHRSLTESRSYKSLSLVVYGMLILYL